MYDLPYHCIYIEADGLHNALLKTAIKMLTIANQGDPIDALDVFFKSQLKLL